MRARWRRSKTLLTGSSSERPQSIFFVRLSDSCNIRFEGRDIAGSPGPYIRSHSRSYPRRTPPHTWRMAAHHCYSSGGRASTNGTSHGPPKNHGAGQSLNTMILKTASRSGPWNGTTATSLRVLAVLLVLREITDRLCARARSSYPYYAELLRRTKLQARAETRSQRSARASCRRE